MALEALELARQSWLGFCRGVCRVGHCTGPGAMWMFGDALAHANAMFRIATEIEHPQRISGAYYALGYSYLLMLQADLAIQNLEAGTHCGKGIWLLPG